MSIAKPMKKLLFMLAASFYCRCVCAQAKTLSVQSDELAPRELKCTEEAISFRVGIRSGWQLSSFRLGYTDFFNGSPNLTSSKDLSGKDIITEPIQLIKYENRANQQGNSSDKNFHFSKKTISPITRTRQFTTGYSLLNYGDPSQRLNLNLPPLLLKWF